MECVKPVGEMYFHYPTKFEDVRTSLRMFEDVKDGSIVFEDYIFTKEKINVFFQLFKIYYCALSQIE